MDSNDNSNKKKRRKKPPVKANVYGVRPRTEISRLTHAEPNEVIGTVWLRELAGVTYITEVAGHSIRDMSKISPFNKVSVCTLERWSVEDDWVKRRQKFMQLVNSEAEARISSRMIAIRVKQVEAADQLADNILNEIDKTQPKSKEGMVTALVKVLEFTNDLRDRLGKEIVPAHLGGVKQETMPFKPTVTDEELRVAIRSIIDKRRDETRRDNKLIESKNRKQRVVDKSPEELIEGEEDA